MGERAPVSLRENREDLRPLLEQIRTRGYAIRETAVTRESVVDAVERFRRFITEVPPEIRDALRVTGYRGRGKGSLGYVERVPENDTIERALGKEPEHKAYFHYHPSLEQTHRAEIDNAGTPASMLMRTMREIWTVLEGEAYDAVRELCAQNIDNPTYADLEKSFFPDGCTNGAPDKRHPRLIVRLMRYMKVRDGALSANNHYDGGMLTFAICESLPGLQVGTRALVDDHGRILRPETMHEVRRAEGTALMWTGATYGKIDPTVEPTWHGVRQHTTGAARGEENRWVLVCFLDMYDEVPPSIEETHGAHPRM